MLTNFAGVYAPGYPVSAIMIEQARYSEHQVRQSKVPVSISPNRTEVKVCNDEVWTQVAEDHIMNEDRYLIVTIGVNSFEFPAKQRMQLKRQALT